MQPGEVWVSDTGIRWRIVSVSLDRQYVKARDADRKGSRAVTLMVEFLLRNAKKEIEKKG